jgi:hypothetical protein
MTQAPLEELVAHDAAMDEKHPMLKQSIQAAIAAIQATQEEILAKLNANQEVLIVLLTQCHCCQCHHCQSWQLDQMHP